MRFSTAPPLTAGTGRMPEVMIAIFMSFVNQKCMKLLAKIGKIIGMMVKKSKIFGQLGFI